MFTVVCFLHNDNTKKQKDKTVKRYKKEEKGKTKTESRGTKTAKESPCVDLLVSLFAVNKLTNQTPCFNMKPSPEHI